MYSIVPFRIKQGKRQYATALALNGETGLMNTLHKSASKDKKVGQTDSEGKPSHQMKDETFVGIQHVQPRP